MFSAPNHSRKVLQLIQQNASAAEEMSTGADELSAQAEALQNAVSFFKVSEMRPQSRRAAAPRVAHSSLGLA
jgi:methyl-accepting chemotaxis protein